MKRRRDDLGKPKGKEEERRPGLQSKANGKRKLATSDSSSVGSVRSCHHKLGSSQGRMPKERSLEFLKDPRWSEEADRNLFAELIYARQQRGKYTGLNWSDDEMWMKITNAMNSEGLHLDTFDIQDRILSYEKAYKKFKSVQDEDDMFTNYVLKTMCAQAFDKTLDIGVPTFSSDPSHSRSSRSRTRTGSMSIGDPSHSSSSILVETAKELQKMLEAKSITDSEYFWAMDYYSEECRAIMFMNMDPGTRDKFIRFHANKKSV